MDISKISVKKIRELIVFTAFLVVALWKFDVVLDVLKAIWGILFPFVLGGAIAFVTNVPMSFLEKKIFGRVKKENKAVEKLARPISLFLTIVFAVGVIVMVMFGVIPQLTRTMGTLMMSIADFIPQMQSWIREFSHNNQEIMKLVDQVQFNPDQAIKWGISLLGNGAGNMMNTTMSAVGSIVSGLATFFIAFSFACYVLFQKEKLHVQVRKVLFAFLPKQKADAFLKVCSLTYRTFANFLAGQCLEAVILGCMFVVILSILRMPYALLIGVLIAFTALIPIFGAFIGCAVGSFLIFMVNPKQAILFIIVFLVLQQIEGNLIYPHVVGESVGLPSIWVLAAVTIGGNLMGIVGMLVFIPLLSVFYTIFREFVYLHLKKQHIKQVTATKIEEYTQDNTGNNISLKNPYFCELTGLYWAWKNLEAENIGLVHYRRYFTNKKKIPKEENEKFKIVLTQNETEELLKKTDIILPKKRKYYIENLYSHYEHTMYIEPLDETRRIIEEKCPEYLSEFDKLHKRTSAHMFNMFIMKKEILDEYCTWLFDILFELEKRTDASKYDSFHARFYGRISELLLDVWVNKNKIKYEEVKVMDMQNVNWLKKGTSFLNAKFTGKKYGKSF